METKQCSKCNELKSLDQFTLLKANKWKLKRYKSICRPCQRAYNKSLKLRNFAFIFRYLKLYGKCIDCGNTDNRVLEFDHIIGEKKSGVIKLGDSLASIQTIKDEIRKCEIRCCNCHRIKTQEQLGWRNEWSDNWLNKESC